jgi:hypothetical protein
MEYLIGASFKVCRGAFHNHFENTERTFRCSVPKLVLTKSDVKTQQSPHKLNVLRHKEHQKIVERKKKL